MQARYDYEFTSLSSLMGDISKRRDLTAFLEETEYFRTMYYLANSLYGVNRRSSAREIWTFLSEYANGEWKGRAQSQLSNPRLDPAPSREAIGR